MKKRSLKLLSLVMASALAAGVGSPISARAEEEAGGAAGEWREEDGNKYWYENGVKQGTEGRGKEIYDPDSNAWYWLDAVDGGKMAVSKDVYQESAAGQWAENEDGTGKWVRYDAKGHMIKGWDGTYYFDPTFGTMAKGNVEIDGLPCWFDEATGIGVNCEWRIIDGIEYWYEGGVRQGLEGRGKEIYDGASDAWYWLDSVDNGKKAVSKDVYQESEAGPWAENSDGTGKWVRYDAEGHMIKGWDTNENGKYYFDLTYGTMAKGIVTIDGTTYRFDSDTGVCQGEYTVSTWSTWLSEKVETLDENDKVISYYINEYERNNNYISVSKRSYYYPAEAEGTEDRLYQVEEYTRDSDGNMISQIVYTADADGNLEEDYKYEYTYVNGRQTEYKYTNVKDPSYNNYHYVYQFDENGKRLACDRYYYSSDMESKEILRSHSEFAYDENGNQIEENVENYAYRDGKEENRYVSSYVRNQWVIGENGELKECLTTRKYNEKDEYVNSELQRYEYDGNGNCLSETDYGWTGSEWVERYKYEYTYGEYNNRDLQMTYAQYENEQYWIERSFEEWRYQFGYEYVRNDETGSVEKITYYTVDKKLNYYWVYDMTSFPKDGDSCQKTDEKYDADDNKTESRRSTYKKYTYER